MSMRIKQVENQLQAFKVRSVAMLPEQRGVEVALSVTGHDLIRFRTKRFGVGRRGAKTAALAKFAASAGFGDAVEIYGFLLDLPRNTSGVIFSERSAQACLDHCDARGQARPSRN